MMTHPAEDLMRLIAHLMDHGKIEGGTEQSALLISVTARVSEMGSPRERAAALMEPGAPLAGLAALARIEAAHDARVTELLKANNEYLERARAATRVAVAAEKRFDLRAEAACCVWEWMLERQGESAEIAAHFTINGTIETRRLAISLAGLCLDTYDELGGENAICALDLIPYDWEFIPAVCKALDWSSWPVWRPPAVSVAETLRAEYRARVAAAAAKAVEP